MCANPGQEPVAKFYEVKLKLEQISMHKTEDAMTRSKAKWCEQGERSTCYFFNLEKRNRSNKHITKLKTKNCTPVTPTKILKEDHKYYQDLLIVDIIKCTDLLDVSGIALFLDFKKAFDSLE